MHFQFDKRLIANDQRSDVECELYQRAVPSESIILLLYVNYMNMRLHKRSAKNNIFAMQHPNTFNTKIALY